MLEQVRKVRQVRQYRPDPVPAEAVDQLLEIARWTGSSRNTQPWHFIVIRDKEALRRISQLRPPINWVADAPMAIAIVLDGANQLSEAYDEGRVTERLLIAAQVLGLGGGVAWFEHDPVGVDVEPAVPAPVAQEGALGGGVAVADLGAEHACDPVVLVRRQPLGRQYQQDRVDVETSGLLLVGQQCGQARVRGNDDRAEPVELGDYVRQQHVHREHLERLAAPAAPAQARGGDRRGEVAARRHDHGHAPAAGEDPDDVADAKPSAQHAHGEGVGHGQGPVVQ
ncbi:MAG: nitroreductase family protein [Micromonosporaceae bacterium]|nr:nitroreductase family protein [Micromonosporaceae bacterium]